MRLQALFVVLFASSGVLALPDPVPTKIATKKTTVTRTARKSTKDPPRPTAACLASGALPAAECDQAYAHKDCNCVVIVRTNATTYSPYSC